MNEFKSPITKLWQKSSEDVNKNFPTVAEGVPNFIPHAAGLIYIDSVDKDVYISVGIQSTSDWRLMQQD